MGADFQLTLIPLIHGAIRHAEGFPVFQADRVDQRQLLDLLGEQQGITRGEHAAGGMTEQRGFLNAQRFEQLLSVGRQLLKAVLIVVGFAGGAKADLVRCDHPVTGLAQGLDRTVPGGCAKVLAVHQHHSAAVGLAVSGDVHVTHLQGFAL
ncbi:hypothetical protein D3C72_388020 [compost metagenome]